MNNKHFLFLFIIISVLSGKSQTINDIKKDPKYIYGIGQAQISDKADKIALSNLVSQISIEVISSKGMHITETNSEYIEEYEMKVKTFSSATLNNAIRIDEENEDGYKVLRYITKEALKNVFEKRKNSIVEYAKAGLNAENKLQIGDALRNLYWANILLLSHPDKDEIELTDNDKTVLLEVFLPNKLNEILSNINAKIVEQKHNSAEKHSKYTIELTYNTKKIQNLDYSFQYKNSWSSPITANNGMAFVEFYDTDKLSEKPIPIRIEYRYEDKQAFDKDVQTVFNSNIDLPYYNCKTLAQNEQIDEPPTVGITVTEVVASENINTKEIKGIIKTIQNNLNANNKKLNSENFTYNGLKAYQQLIEYGNAKPLITNNELKVKKINNEVLVRSVPMQFSFSKNRSFIEDVVFIFNQENKIDDINFSLSDTAVNDILSRQERFATIDEKYFLIRFMETYKTAYCLKRLDYLQKVFDDDALIIVGRKVEPKGKSDFYTSSLSDDNIEYQRLSKSEYINRLQNVFSSNEYINIHFEDNIVKKAKRDMSIYGIQIAQHYNSERYADKGYLFLMVDLRDTLNPVVHVRTWQPEKNADGSIIGLSDFPFNKL